jgi:hypothetical protein
VKGTINNLAFVLIGIWMLLPGRMPAQGLHYDAEFIKICLVDSIAPDTINQFWRFTHANNPGEFVRDVTFDLSGAYTVSGTVQKCCECLSQASAYVAPANPHAIAAGISPRMSAAAFNVLVLVALIWIISAGHFFSGDHKKRNWHKE